MIETNKQGGKQTKITEKPTELPPMALLAVAAVMAEGSEAYPREADGTPNWFRISSKSNLDHSLRHAFLYQAEMNGPENDRDWAYACEELTHFVARGLMALERLLEEMDTAEWDCPEDHTTTGIWGTEE